MKVHVIGAGPAGLYFSILMKGLAGDPHHVFERNRPDDTFGWRCSTRPIRSNYDRELSRHHQPLCLLGRHRDPFRAPHRIGGSSFCGARETLLNLGGRALARRRIKYQTESRRSTRARDADLVVADGINSRMRGLR
jgi:anthraniloyl-CoA monooxygenase